MKTFTVLFAVLLVSLFITTEAKPWGRPGRGNRPDRPGRRDDRPDQPNGCIRRCPRPNPNTLVCAFDGVRNRTFPSECFVERFECNTGRNMTITDGPCPDVAFQMNGMLSMETESEEDSSEESREDGSTPGQSTSVPVEPSFAATTSRTTPPTTGTASPTTSQTTTPTTATATATAPTTTPTQAAPTTMPIGSGATAQNVPTQPTPPFEGKCAVPHYEKCIVTVGSETMSNESTTQRLSISSVNNGRVILHANTTPSSSNEGMKVTSEYVNSPSDEVSDSIVRQPVDVTVYEGDGLATISCEFVAVNERDQVVSFRRGNDIISDELGLRSGELQQLGLIAENYSIKRNINVGTYSRSYDLSIKSPTRNDTSDYKCVLCKRDKITSMCSGKIVLSSQVASLTVQYLPGDAYPICNVPSNIESNASYVDVQEGKAVEIVCSSETGSPLVELAWTQHGAAVKGQVAVEGQVSTGKNMLTESRVMFVPSMEDNGTVLICTLTSAAFEGDARNCSTLPFVVSADGSNGKEGPLGLGGLTRTIIIIVILVLVIVILIVTIVIVYVTKRKKRDRGSTRGHNIEYQPADTVDKDDGGSRQRKGIHQSPMRILKDYCSSLRIVIPIVVLVCSVCTLLVYLGIQSYNNETNQEQGLHTTSQTTTHDIIETAVGVTTKRPYPVSTNSASTTKAPDLETSEPTQQETLPQTTNQNEPPTAGKWTPSPSASNATSIASPTTPSAVTMPQQTTSDQSQSTHAVTEMIRGTTEAAASGSPVDVSGSTWSCPADGQCDWLPSDPVCGSDGKTYSNLCVMRDSACKAADFTLQPVKRGNCTKGVGNEECFDCEDFFDPVCGSNKRSYLNVCQLKREVCRTRNFQLKVSFEGLCELPVMVCTSRQCDPFKGTPMCGTDGVTYPSLCYLRKTACKRRDYSLVEAYDGGCVAGKLTNVCQEHCIGIWSPVCGSDGLTYRNYCFLQRAACRVPGLFHANDGPCKLKSNFWPDIVASIP
ncbi:uncharacterized protein [Asterias amurensis]|uniref:uncharacterized protein n=1 Tax=Asterias amurensis TaxID=7602 RepID=UPI003AB6FD5C